MGPRIAVIKKGEHGALLLADGKPFAIPAWPSEAVNDPTGAGDCFGGAMIGHLAKTGGTSFDALKTAASYGTVAASFCIEDFSVRRLRSVSMNDIERRRNELSEITSWT